MHPQLCEIAIGVGLYIKVYFITMEMMIYSLVITLTLIHCPRYDSLRLFA